MKGYEILKALQDLTVESTEEIQERINKITIKGISYHSGKIKPGEAFVCIKGYETDGHKYLKDAVKKGAVLAIVEDHQEEVDVPQISVKDSRVALAKLGAAFYQHPSRNLRMIGITATNGKTTTSFMVHKILQDAKMDAGIIGTVMVQYRDKKIPALLTTPESLDLQGHFADMIKEGISHVTMEVSSSAQELSRVVDVDFDIVSMNNISKDHIDNHGSFERYFEVKSRLITWAKPESTVILNLDCPYSKSLITETKGNVVTFGIDDTTGDFTIEDLDLSTGRGYFNLVIPREINLRGKTVKKGKVKVALSVPGYHSVYNSIVAAIIGLAVGVSPEAVAKSLQGFKGVERRFEFIYEKDFTIVDDHFANPGNIEMTLETLEKMDYRRLHILYAIRGRRGAVVNRENADALVKWVPKLKTETFFATEGKGYVMEKDRVTEEERRIFDEVTKEAGMDVTVYPTLQESIDAVLARAKKDDVILLAGCQGMDFGGKLILEALAVGKGEEEQKEILKPLEHRVAGIEEL